MPLDDAYQAGTDAALADMVQRPAAPKPQEPRFSIWGTLTAAPKGVAAGTAQAIGSAADVLGAFGSVLGSTPASGGGMFATQTDAERKQTIQAADKLRTSGPDYLSNAGRSFRNVAADYMPDPVTAHTAENAVANLFRVGSKAMTAAAALGPVAGAAVSGAEEGFTTADELAQKGVDPATRTAAGAVTAAVQAVGFALPVAGQTWGQTLGLALAGGPVSFVTQQAATREILQRADYGKLADQYDPFDPVGLTLSTLLPLGFGALAMRAGSKAKGPEPQPEAPRADDESVDAARTALLAENLTATRPSDAPDLQGQHEQAYGRALDQLSSGQRVDVSDVAPVSGNRIVSEMQTRLEPLAKALQDEPAPVAGQDFTPPPVVAEPVAKPQAEQQAGALPVEDAQLAARADLIEQTTPDLMVQLDGMDAPEPAAQIMARLREDVAQDMAEAPLLQVAAECFLSTQR